MIQALSQVANRLLALLKQEEAQDVFEYILIVGGVSVVLVAAIVAIGANAPGLVTTVCTLIDGLIGGAAFTC